MASRSNQSDAVRVIGIDPGSRKMGIAVVEGALSGMRPVAFATIRFSQPSMVGRLQTLYEKLTDWVIRYRPQAAAVEDVFVRNNARSALVLGQARGVALLALGTQGIDPVGYAPATIKRTVAGHGRAGKSEMRLMVRYQLGLAEPPPEDAADALAVAMTHITGLMVRQRMETV